MIARTEVSQSNKVIQLEVELVGLIEQVKRQVTTRQAKAAMVASSVLTGLGLCGVWVGRAWPIGMSACIVISTLYGYKAVVAFFKWKRGQELGQEAQIEQRPVHEKMSAIVDKIFAILDNYDSLDAARKNAYSWWKSKKSAFGDKRYFATCITDEPKQRLLSANLQERYQEVHARLWGEGYGTNLLARLDKLHRS